MHELTGEESYGQKVGQFLQSLKNGQKTPGGMFFIQQWGSARHAANAAFLIPFVSTEVRLSREFFSFLIAPDNLKKVRNSAGVEYQEAMNQASYEIFLTRARYFVVKSPPQFTS